MGYFNFYCLPPGGTSEVDGGCEPGVGEAWSQHYDP